MIVHQFPSLTALAGSSSEARALPKRSSETSLTVVPAGARNVHAAPSSAFTLVFATAEPNVIPGAAHCSSDAGIANADNGGAVFPALLYVSTVHARLIPPPPGDPQATTSNVPALAAAGTKSNSTAATTAGNATTFRIHAHTRCPA